jgi:hypothetical protein
MHAYDAHVIRIKSLRKDRIVLVEIPVDIDGGQEVKRGVIDRARLMGDQKDASSTRPTLLVAKLSVPNTLTLLPAGKKGDTSESLPDTVRNAPDVLRKLKARDIAIIQENAHGGR